MKKNRIIAALLAALFVLAPCAGCGSAHARETATYRAVAGADAKIRVQKVGEEQNAYIFIPSCVDLASVPLKIGGNRVIFRADDGTQTVAYDGEPVDLSAFGIAPEKPVVLSMTDGGETSTPVTVMQSANISSVFIVSRDPLEHGQEWINTGKGHPNRTEAWMLMLDSDGGIVYNGKLDELRGRGNSTWAQPKKPYQIKLDKKTDLLGTDKSENRAKKWLLLANYFDASMIRNAAAYDYSRAVGLSDTVEYTYADLWYDGIYCGTYMITEKVEIKPGRVDITDLESVIEAKNKSYDFSDPILVKDETPWGTPMQYVDGLNEPADITGGYLIEFEVKDRIEGEASYFFTKNGTPIFVREPKYLSKNELLYIANYFQEFEDAVANGGVNPTTGKRYTDYVDFDSLVKCYAVMELSGNNESMYNSTFFYKDRGDAPMYFGPLWDYDLAFSLYDDQLRIANTPFGKMLMELDDFRDAVNELFRETLYPFAKASVAGDGSLPSLAKKLTPSARMNYVLWEYRYYYAPAQAGDGFEPNVDFLLDYIDVRCDFLLGEFARLAEE